MNCMTIFVIIGSIRITYSANTLQSTMARGWAHPIQTLLSRKYSCWRSSSAEYVEKRNDLSFWPAQTSPKVCLQSHQWKNDNWENVAFWNEFCLHHPFFFSFSVAYSSISHCHSESLPTIVLLNMYSSSPYQVVVYLNHHNI